MKAILLFTIMCLLMACGSKSELYYIEPEKAEQETGLQYSINGTIFEYTESADKTISNPSGTFRFLGNIKKMEDYIYHAVNGMVYRYNPETGNITTLCSDPLCSHQSNECVFFGNTSIGTNVYGNSVYFTQKYQYPIEKYEKVTWKKIDRKVRYDIANQKLEVLKDYTEMEFDGNRYISEYFYENYYYYLNNIVNSRNELHLQICRENLNTGRTEILKEMGTTPINFVYVDSERVYYTYGSQICYIGQSDPTVEVMVFKNVSQDTSCDGKYFYQRVNHEDVYKIFRCDMNGKNGEYIVEDDVTNMFLTERYIYYSLNQMIEFAGTEVQACKDIYRYDKETGEVECVFTMPEDMQNYYLSRYYLVDGNYIYTEYGCWDEEKRELWECNDEDGCHLMRINVQTGEIYYIDYNY